MSGQTPDYLFGQLAGEAERLRLQARMFARYTARFLEDAGISPGMKVLDVGTGAGDVALLVAGLVGREGTVVGIDFNSELIETAQARAATAPELRMFHSSSVMRLPLWLDQRHQAPPHYLSPPK